MEAKKTSVAASTTTSARTQTSSEKKKISRSSQILVCFISFLFWHGNHAAFLVCGGVPACSFQLFVMCVPGCMRVCVYVCRASLFQSVKQWKRWTL